MQICGKKKITLNFVYIKYAISQLRIVHSGLHLVTYLDLGNFCEKTTEFETTLHEICVQVFLRFSDSSKPSQYILFIYVLAWLARISIIKRDFFYSKSD